MLEKASLYHLGHNFRIRFRAKFNFKHPEMSQTERLHQATVVNRLLLDG